MERIEWLCRRLTRPRPHPHSEIPSRAYELAPDAEFVTFGMEYEPDWEGNGNGMIAWYVDGKRTWSIKSDAVPPRPNIGVAQRLIPVEPMAVSGSADSVKR